MVDPVLTGPSDGRRRHRPLLRTMVGDVLRRTRLEQGRTLAEVAQQAKVSMPYLSELERGLKEGSSEVLAAICDALGLDLSDLLAQVGSDLAEDRARHDQVASHDRVIQLDSFRGARAPSALGAAMPSVPGGSPQVPGSGDVRCLLAA
jgi:transcriptional regulator with XRE-family HTH domain